MRKLNQFLTRVFSRSTKPARRPSNPSKRLVLEILETREVPSVYYVAATGSNSNSGTAASPFATLQHAMMSLQPGDTLNVEPGTYAGFIAGWDSVAASTGDQYGTIDGTASQPITIQAAPGSTAGSVIINARDSKTAFGIDLEPGCNYVAISGFTINDTGSITTTSSHGGGIKLCGNYDSATGNTITNITFGFGILADLANDVLLKDNTISGTGNQGNADYGHGIYLSGTNSGAVIEGNVIYSNSYVGIHINGDASEGGIGQVTDALIEDNVIYNNGQNAINADGLQSSTIENNLIYGYANYGVCLYYSDSTGPSIDNLIVNNTIVSTVSGAGAAIRILDQGTGNTSLNNILLGADGNTYRISSNSLSGFVSNYNIVSANVQSDDTGSEETFAQWQTQTGQDTHSLVATASQLFVNASANNYQLSATSPAVNAGTSLDAPATDIAGNPRPQGSGIDIGCYQLPSFSLSPGSLPASTVGVAYSQKITASGGTGSITLSESGSLPAGLTFTASTGTLSGTPTASGTFNLSVTATDSVGDTATQAYTLTINPALSLSPGSLPASTVGVAYSQQITVSGGTGSITFSESGSLPAGLTFTASTGTLSGTPTASGTFNLSVTATDSVGDTTSKSYSLTINPASSVLSLSPGSLPASTVGVAYSQKITASGGTGSITLSESGSLPAGLTFTASTGTLSGTPTAGGTFNLSVTATDSVGDTATQAYTLTINPALSLSPGSLPASTVGVAYSQKITATGGTGTITFSESGSLPAGLTFTASTGTLSGTPTASGTFNLSVTATDSVGATATQPYTLTINPATTGKTFYVATTGNNSNSGTAASPFATLQYAMMSLQPGDTLNVEPGTYAGFIAGWDSVAASTGDQYGTIDGTASQPITIQAAPGSTAGSVIINARDSKTAFGIDLEPGCNYVAISGFTINDTGSITTTSSHGGGIKLCGNYDSATGNTITNITFGFGILADLANDVLLKDNTISGTGNQGNADYGHGIYLSGTNSGAVIEGNVIYGNSYVGIHINGDASEGGIGQVTDALIEDNVIYNNGQNAINADGLQSSTIENNLIYGYANYGVCLYYSDSTGPSIDNLIVNNTIVSTVSGAGAAIRILDQGTGNTSLNNILLGADGNTYRISSNSLSGFVSNYNIVSANVQSDDTGSEETFAQWQTQTGQDTHSLVATASQLFVNASANNYQLSATSPAVNAGTSLDAPATDIAGNPRPQGSGIDIGCYQLPSFSLSPGSLPASTVGVAYSQKITASGGTGSITLSESGSLPAGLTFTASTGTLSGTPTASGTFNLSVTATDSVGDTATQTYALTINPTLSLSPGSLPASTVGVAYSQKITTSGGTGSITLSESGSLPAGLTFTASTGTLSGTPTASGTFNLSLIATDSIGATGTQTYTLTINPALSFSPGSLPASTVGVAYSQKITTSGGTGSITLSESGSLPAGLTFTASTGTLSGTPTASGTFNLSVIATDSIGATVTQTYTLTINPALSFSPGSLPASTVGVAYSQKITTSGGTGSITLSESGSLPAGLTFTASTGTLSGTPTASGTFNLSVTATDSVGATATQQYTLTTNSSFTLALSTSASSITAGSPLTVTVTALTGSGTTATNYTGTVHFTSSDGQAVLPANYTFTAADAGIHTFSVTLKTAGTDTITATDTSTSSIVGSASVTVNPATASSYSLSGFPSSTTAGTALTFTLKVLDVYGNVANSYTGTVHFTSSDAKAVLPANYTFTTADAGVHTFSATLNTAGTDTITATDTSTSSLAASASVTVNPAPTTQLPTVKSETPAAKAKGVNTSTIVQAVFSEAVQSSSISFVLKSASGKAVPATLSYNSSTYTATLTPSAALANGTTYTATISGAKNSSGAVMAAPMTWSFTTVAKLLQTTPADFNTGTSNGTALSTPVTVGCNWPRPSV